MTTILSVLEGARALVSRDGGWTQHVFARDQAGGVADLYGSDAHCFCMIGALRRIAPADVLVRRGASKLLASEIGAPLLSIPSWQDRPQRTQAEVVAVFDKAILAERAALEAGL